MMEPPAAGILILAASFPFLAGASGRHAGLDPIPLAARDGNEVKA
jgi:hypothetical protein